MAPCFERARQCQWSLVEGAAFINVASTLSKVGQRFPPSHVVSKFALRGLSEALRSELAEYPAFT